MKIDPRFRRLAPVFFSLLGFMIIGGLLFKPSVTNLPSETLQPPSRSTNSQSEEASSEGSHKKDGSHEHGKTEKHIDYSNPGNQRRMGIFHYNEGNKFLIIGDWRQAVSNYRMALRHDSEIYEVYINLSTAFLKGGQFADALKTLKTLQTKQPENPMLYYNIACYYSRTGNVDAGFLNLDKAFRFGFDNKTQLLSDPDLENLRNDPRFNLWVKKK